MKRLSKIIWNSNYQWTWGWGYKQRPRTHRSNTTSILYSLPAWWWKCCGFVLWTSYC